MSADIVRCVGCRDTMPLSQTSVHDATCPHHSKHGPARWSDCTHKGSCYEQPGEDEGTAA